MSRIVFDPDDYASLAEMPSDDELLFVRVQEFATTVGGWRTVLGVDDNGVPILGPIVVVPTAALFSRPRAPLSLTGNAPANTLAAAGGIVPLHEDSQTPNPMHIILPRPATIKLRNLGSVGLLFAFGLEHPLETLSAGSEKEVVGGVKELLLASADNSGVAAVAPLFNITAVVNMGVSLDG
jgi:Kef-type K+ transport system membrane component KefB